MATLKDTQDAQTKPLRIGVLIHAPVQLLDVSAIDLFGMLTRDYLAACKLPSPIVNLGVPVEIKYISSVPFTPPSEALSTKSLSATLISPASPPALAEMTASAALRLSTHIGDESVAPGMLDILFIPGPDPGLEIPEAVGVWLRGHREHGESDESVKNGKQGKSTGVTLMSVCTGIFILASSGVLDGYVATGPRALVGELSAQHPRVKWVDNVRWVRSGGKEGRIWTSGGITNGLDMVAAYIREHYPGPLSDTVCMLADVGDRGSEYRTGKVVSNGLWVWAILRAWWGRKRTAA